MGRDFAVSELIDKILQVAGRGGNLYLHEPTLGDLEKKNLIDCIDSTFVSSVGRYVGQFEAKIAEFTNSKYAIAVSNGTSALHVSLILSGVTALDEVIVPALSFVATANAVSYIGATPHFVDSEENTLGMCPDKLRAHLEATALLRNGICINKITRRPIKAIVPMHTFGHSVRMDEIVAVAADFNLVVVEDAAEGLGSYYKKRHVGTFGTFGIISFNGNKIITTGAGGIILTQNSELARRAKHITTTAKMPHKWAFNHDEVGFNYRMANLNAALGCAQLDRLDALIAHKKELLLRYQSAFSSLTNYLRLVTEPKDCESNYWLQTILLDESVSEMRDDILDAGHDKGVMIRPAWTLGNLLAPFLDCPKANLDVAESLSRRLINLPSGYNI